MALPSICLVFADLDVYVLLLLVLVTLVNPGMVIDNAPIQY